MRQLSAILLLMPMLAAQTELRLADAVGKALAAHPSVAASEADVRMAAGRVAEARAWRWFRADYRESVTRGDNPVYVFGTLLSQRQFTESNFAVGSLNRPDFVNNFQSVLSVERPVWDAGRRRFAEAEARTTEKVSQVMVRQTQVELIAMTARAYLDAALAQEAVRVAEQGLASAEADRDRAVTIRDAGRATDADVLSVEVHVAQMREQVIAQQGEKTRALAALNEAMGSPLDTEYVLLTKLAAIDVSPVTEVDRAEVEASGLRREALVQQVSAARAALWPRLDARFAFEADRQRFVTRGGGNWFAGVSLSWNLFDGGANRARVKSASAAVEAATARERVVASHVALEVKQAESLVTEAKARWQATGTTVAMAEESLRITQNRYSAGFATVTDLLRAESASLDAKLRRLMAVHGVRMAQLQLAAANGSLNADAEVLR